jgi:hypothetical protein
MFGNPAEKPKGSRHRITMLAEQLFEGEAEGLIRKAIERALAGDSTALRRDSRSVLIKPGA